MKKATLTIVMGILVAVGAGQAFAQPGVTEEQIKSQTAAFDESNVFYNVDDSTQDFKSAAFKGDDAEGSVKCWRWYYRPTYTTYYWRPVYYRPYYCYYRYYCAPCYCNFTWTTVAVYKGAENKGAMLDTDPTDNSPLKALGLKKGDIITAIDGKALTSLADMKKVTSRSDLTVHKGDNVKFAGNLLKKTDQEYAKQFDGMQEVEAGTLLTKSEIEQGNFSMYNLYQKFAVPVFGIKATENNGNGVKVTEVVMGLPGQKSGFEVNDVILEINGEKIDSEKSYSDAIDRAGKFARMKVLCGKTNQTVDADVTLNK